MWTRCCSPHVYVVDKVVGFVQADLWCVVLWATGRGPCDPFRPAALTYSVPDGPTTNVSPPVQHAAVWHRLQMRTVAVKCDIDQFFFPRQWTGLPALMRELREVVRKAEENGDLLVGHAFSNGGALLLQELLASEVASTLCLPSVLAM